MALHFKSSVMRKMECFVRFFKDYQSWHESLQLFTLYSQNPGPIMRDVMFVFSVMGIIIRAHNAKSHANGIRFGWLAWSS